MDKYGDLTANADASRQTWLEHREECGKCAKLDKDAEINAILHKCMQGWRIVTN